MPLPKFNDARKGIDVILEGKPPVRFVGVTVRVFPLRANMYRLRTFCDQYLNIAPDIVQFRPVLPYVYLLAVNYGQMTAQYRYAGWVAQHEIAFAVPLEWYRVENGRLVFVDWPGSGNQTATHVAEHGRITLMFCSFDRTALILRVYGRGRVVAASTAEFAALAARLDGAVGPHVRQLIDIQVVRVQTSCGYAVPHMAFEQERPLLTTWATKRGPDGITAYHQEKNLVSIDGLPTGMRT